MKLVYLLFYADSSSIFNQKFSLKIKLPLISQRLLGTTLLLLLILPLYSQTPTPQDCLGAIPVYQPVIYEPIPGMGYGNYTDEIDPSITCVSVEENSIWYTFTAETDGILNFVITPDTLEDDYDWALFDLTNANCEDIFSDTTLMVSCNAAGGSGCHGPTGATGATTFNNQGGGCGVDPPYVWAGFSPFNDLVPIIAGNTYALMVTNWTGSDDGFTIDFSGSTGIEFTDSIPPFIETLNVPNECQGNTIEIEFSQYIQCSTINESNFQLSGPGEPYTLTLSSFICDQGGNLDKFFTLAVSPFMIPGGDYTLNLIVEGSTEILDLNNNPVTDTTISFSTTYLLPNAPMVSSNQFVGDEILVDEGEIVTLTPISNNLNPNPDFNYYSDAALTNLVHSGSFYSFVATNSSFIYVTEFYALCESPATVVPISIIEPPLSCPPTIEFIMVNGCASAIEPDGEFMILSSGENGFYVDSLEIDFPSSIPGVNEDIIINGECQILPTPLINSLQGCPNVILSGQGDYIPPNQLVLFMTSYGGTPEVYDWTPLCGEGQIIYLMQSACDRTAGAFKDYEPGVGLREIKIFHENCSDVLIYFPEDLASGCSGNCGNGDYVMSCGPSPTCPDGVSYGHDGCVAPSYSNFITQQNNIVNNQQPLSLFPNPAKDEIRIEWKENIEFSIFISDLNGSEIIQQSGIGDKIDLSVGNLAQGVYFVRSLFENGEIRVAKFVKY